MSGSEILHKFMDDDINHFDFESKKHKKLYRLGRTMVISLTALTTITAGIGLILPESSIRVTQFGVLCLTAITTGVSAWVEMRRARELW